MWVLYVSIIAQETFYFQVISRNYMPIALLGTSGCFICCIATFVGHETPIWSLKAGKVEEGIRTLKFIAKVNKKTEHIPEIEELRVSLENCCV
jgi:hypothetical protein